VQPERNRKSERKRERREKVKAATLWRPHSCENKYCKTKKKMYCM
jgi:hypothetical protein